MDAGKELFGIIEGGDSILVAVGIDEDEEACGIFFHRIAEIKNPSKRTEALNLINDLNHRYNCGKFVLEDDGSISALHHIEIARDGVFSPRSAMDSVVKVFDAIEKNYSRFMRLQW